ncbi:MAG: ABC transporter permease subunit [bacterium]|nr:ABC transporter permease subunit [bacterium]
MAKTKQVITKRKVTNVIVHIILAILSLIWIAPILWIIMTSFRGEKGAYPPTFLPTEWTLRNYNKLFTDTDIFNFPRWFGNTFIVAVFTCILTTIFIICISFCMSRMRFKMRKPYLNIALILGMFPGFMAIMAVYYILKGLGLLDGGLKLVALILVYSGGSGILNFYVVKGFFDTIPKTIDEAAFVDGARKWDVFTKITIPLSKPIIIYTILTSFMAPWVDFILSKVIIGTDAKYYTVAIGMWNMLEKENVYQWYTTFFAAAVIVSIPIAAIFLVMQRFYTDGMAGAVKG